MQRVSIPSGTIEYLEHGSGRPVVFVHGLLVDCHLWDGVVEALGDTHRCIAPTWPLGSHRVPLNDDADLSPRGVARVVADFLGALDLRDVILVGNDSGGAITQLVAAHHRERLAGVVLTNCDALDVFPPKEFAYLSLLPRLPGAMWILAQSMRLLPPLRRLSIAYGALTSKPLPSELLGSWVQPAARTRGVRRDAAKFIRGVSPQVTLGAADALADFDKPFAIAWGTADRFFPASLPDRLAARVPGATVEPLEGAGVFSPLDDPAGVTAVIRALGTHADDAAA